MKISHSWKKEAREKVDKSTVAETTEFILIYLIMKYQHLTSNFQKVLLVGVKLVCYTQMKLTV
jgi:hypothetical protein